MSHFMLMWKARVIERKRKNYEREKLNSILTGKGKKVKESFYQKYTHWGNRLKKKLGKILFFWFPRSKRLSRYYKSLKTDQTFANFLLKSVVGFLSGFILTYLIFLFFVFQLALSLTHATIMCSIIGVMLTLGLAFSYRVRCLVFLMIPQFFSEVGRYTLIGYALILILTGPAKNTLHNSAVLTESLACGQEQLRNGARQIKEAVTKPFKSMKDTIRTLVESLKSVAEKVKKSLTAISRLILSIVRVVQTGISWLSSVVRVCNKSMGTPSERCHNALEDSVADCRAKLGPYFSWLCSVTYVAKAACYMAKVVDYMCLLVHFVKDTIVGTIKKRLRQFTNHIHTMMYVEVSVKHTYKFHGTASKSASLVAAGIVTELRQRADAALQLFSWMSCVTSVFVLFIIIKAKYYQFMYVSSDRFDNHYITKEFIQLELARVRAGRETVLPLTRREKRLYVRRTSLRLVRSEKLHLVRSILFLSITTFKLLIHMVADYSLYWILTTIRHHGRFMTMEAPRSVLSVKVEGSSGGWSAESVKAITDALSSPSTGQFQPGACLPIPSPPDFKRYTQVGFIIGLLWITAILGPYGLRMRSAVVAYYKPMRARQRAIWLYNRILRRRGGFLKYARRKLHRDHKLTPDQRITFKQWLDAHIPCWWLRRLLGTSPGVQCLLCGASEQEQPLIHCETPGCVGVYCMSCFNDLGKLCTICLKPQEYGDLSDVSEEKDSSDDNDDSSLEGASNARSPLLGSAGHLFSWKFGSNRSRSSDESRNDSGDSRSSMSSSRSKKRDRSYDVKTPSESHEPDVAATSEVASHGASHVVIKQPSRSRDSSERMSMECQRRDEAEQSTTSAWRNLFRARTYGAYNCVTFNKKGGECHYLRRPISHYRPNYEKKRKRKTLEMRPRSTCKDEVMSFQTVKGARQKKLDTLASSKDIRVKTLMPSSESSQSLVLRRIDMARRQIEQTCVCNQIGQQVNELRDKFISSVKGMFSMSGKRAAAGCVPELTNEDILKMYAYEMSLNECSCVNDMKEQQQARKYLSAIHKQYYRHTRHLQVAKYQIKDRSLWIRGYIWPTNLLPIKCECPKRHCLCTDGKPMNKLSAGDSDSSQSASDSDKQKSKVSGKPKAAKVDAHDTIKIQPGEPSPPGDHVSNLRHRRRQLVLRRKPIPNPAGTLMPDLDDLVMKKLKKLKIIKRDAPEMYPVDCKQHCTRMMDAKRAEHGFRRVQQKRQKQQKKIDERKVLVNRKKKDSSKSDSSKSEAAAKKTKSKVKKNRADASNNTSDAGVKNVGQSKQNEESLPTPGEDCRQSCNSGARNWCQKKPNQRAKNLGMLPDSGMKLVADLPECGVKSNNRVGEPNKNVKRCKCYASHSKQNLFCGFCNTRHHYMNERLETMDPTSSSIASKSAPSIEREVPSEQWDEYKPRSFSDQHFKFNEDTIGDNDEKFLNVNSYKSTSSDEISCTESQQGDQVSNRTSLL